MKETQKEKIARWNHEQYLKKKAKKIEQAKEKLNQKLFIGERLAIIRYLRGYSQKELCEKAGIGIATYRYMEQNGASRTSFKTWLKLADFYNLSLDYLIGREVV